MSTKSTFVSAISNKEFPIHERIEGSIVREPILSLIKKEYPTFNSKSEITTRNSQ